MGGFFVAVLFSNRVLGVSFSFYWCQEGIELIVCMP